MAPAVSPPGATEPPRDATWAGKGVGLREVLTRLDSMHKEMARIDWEPDRWEHTHPRSCVMNIVAVAPDVAAARTARASLRHLSSAHPARIVVVVPDDRGTGLDAEIRSEARRLDMGGALQTEDVMLHVRGEAAGHMASILEPFLVSDVRTHVWWLGTPPAEMAGFRGALDLADTLIVDSAHFERPFAAFIKLAELARQMDGRVCLTDLQWARVQPWRSAVSQFFGPSERRPFLEGINGIGIDYVGEARANRAAAVLLAGWLISTLDWRLKRAVGGQGGTVAAYFESPKGSPVEVASRSVRPDHYAVAEEGELTAFRLYAVARGRTCQVVIQRDSEDPGRASMTMEIGGGDPITGTLMLGRVEESELLARLLVTGRPDAVYGRALQSGAELLSAFL